MEYNLANLVKAATLEPVFKVRIAKAILRYSNDVEARSMAANLVDDTVDIDIEVLESMINPDKFEFAESDIGTIGLEK